MTPKTTPLDVRFWAQVGGPNNAGCWPWIGYIAPSGYGDIGLPGGRNARAHRVAYELLVGPIPPGLKIDHLCHNEDTACPGGWACLHRRCVNPAHLEAVTQRVNLLRGRTVTAAHAAATHCPMGHPYDEANTYVNKRGSRFCRACWGRWRRDRKSA